MPRPRAALSAATVWAITDFTADNGATVAIPGSHFLSRTAVTFRDVSQSRPGFRGQSLLRTALAVLQI